MDKEYSCPTAAKKLRVIRRSSVFELICIAKAFAEHGKNQSPPFMGILRVVKAEDVDGQSREDTTTKVQKIKREDLPNSIYRICEEFQAVFPKD